MAKLIEKIKKDIEQKRQKTLTIKVVMESDLATKLEFVLKHSKTVLECESGLFFNKQFIESQRKTIDELYEEMYEIVTLKEAKKPEVGEDENA